MKNIISTDKAPAAIGPYSQAIIVDKFLFASGQIPINPASGEVEAEGIVNISKEDVEYAKIWGGVIKLIGRAKKLENGKISATVGPCLIKNGCQLASVSDVFNAILVRGDAVGDVVFYGRGAGKFPTASAVVADVIDCAKHTDKRKLIGWDDAENDYVINPSEQSSSLYIRATVSDYNAVAEKVKVSFSDVQILEAETKTEIAFVTPLRPIPKSNLPFENILLTVFLDSKARSKVWSLYLVFTIRIL